LNTTMTYTLGLSVLTQGDNAGTPNVYHLMHDGHGSVRALLNQSTPTLAAAYAYDAYGNAEGFTAGSATTRHLYAGEQYDAHLGSYYLRARWYDAATGRFNRMDPFAGCHGLTCKPCSYSSTHPFQCAGSFHRSPAAGLIVHEHHGGNLVLPPSQPRRQLRRQQNMLD
jgi:RHS repeat-associated protein